LAIQELPENEILYTKETFIKNLDTKIKTSLELIKSQMRSYLLSYENIKKDLLTLVRSNIYNRKQKILSMKKKRTF
jgi:hypothetical protein